MASGGMRSSTAASSRPRLRLLFFDATKNKRRRWCEMEVCGNRAKQKRRRARG
jgi:predicted RNA-binding Zn ribbon-like protein